MEATPEQWSPWFSWFMDLAKFVITFGATALVSLFGISKIQEKRAKKRSRDEALFQLQMDALREFRRAAINYEVSALSAYTDIYQWKGGEKTSIMQHYESIAFGDFNAAIDGLQIRFKKSGNTQNDLSTLEDLHKSRHAIYDELVDSQLDSDDDLNLWDEANENRENYDSFLDQARELRKKIIASIETKIIDAD